MTKTKISQRKAIRSLRVIPDFTSEDEERDWWAEHDLSEKLYDDLQVASSEMEELLGAGGNAGIVVRFEVKGPPPVYGAAQSIFNPRHPHARRVALLRRKAEKAMKGRDPVQQPIVMAVSQVYTLAAMADATNILGAISSALEGIVYANDSLIREAHFRATEGTPSLYRISIASIR
ncbi:MAG: hypothetical protein IH959_04630 [Chloroflexi bacterium]|nr:hypothetical protein [Chloroflexota bacterium]